MISRDGLAAWVRATLLVLVYAAALTVGPVLIVGLSTWVTVPHVDWFHYHADYDAPPLAQQVHGWFVATVETLRVALDDRAREALVVMTVLGGSWLGLVWISLSTLWCLARDGAGALRKRAACWGPRGWIASLLATLVLSGTASPAYAATDARPVATAAQHPDPTAPHANGARVEQPATPGDHTRPPPREPGVHLPTDLRPDCPRYRVIRGDTLSKIAERELGTVARVRDLVQLNAFHLGRNPDHLEPGWEVLIPPGTTPHQDPTKVVTVASGDTLWSLSERELGTPHRWGQLWDLNLRRTQPDGLQLVLPDRLQPGWQIVVPDEPHNQPPAGDTPTAPVPSKDPAIVDPWPAPFPPTQQNRTPEPNPNPAPGPPPGVRPGPDTQPTRDTPPHDEDRGDHERGVGGGDGVQPAPGVFLGLGLAAAINVALARARLRHHSKYTPGRPFLDYHPTPTVYALRIAHLNATHDPETHAPRTSAHTHPTEVDPPAARATPGSPSGSTPSPDAGLPVELGVQHEQTVRLDLATCHGLGLSGPRDADAVRALLLQLLSRHTPREEPPTQVVMPRADAELLLPDLDDPPNTVHLVTDLPDALQLLDQASSSTAPSPTASTQDTQGAADTHTVLITRSPIEHAHRLHVLLRERRDLAAVFLGPWPHGVTLTSNHRGVLTHASPDSSQHLRGSRLFTATPQAAADLLPLTPTPRTPLAPNPPPVNLVTLTGYDPDDTDASRQRAFPPRGHNPAPTPAASAQALHTGTERTTSSTTLDEPARAAPGDVLDTDPPLSAPTTISDPARAATDTAPRQPARDPQAPPLRLHVFGNFRLVWTDPTGTEHDLPCTRGQRMLLSYLALHPHGIARQTLLEHLWAQASQPTNTCNTQLSRLRQNLHHATAGEVSDVINTTHHRFRLDPSTVGSDYADFDHAAEHLRHASTTDEREQALHTLLACHTGPLGADLQDYEWLHIPRYEAERLHINAVGELARLHVNHDPNHTLHLLESALRDDPYNEALYRDIMRLQHQLDLAHTISHTYTLLKTRLSELDLDPDPQTTTLAEQLL